MGEYIFTYCYKRFIIQLDFFRGITLLKKARLSILGIALLCFLLPWINVSCASHQVGSFNGFQLAGGATIEGERMNGDPLAVMVLLLILAGAALFFFDYPVGGAGAGVFGA